MSWYSKLRDLFTGEKTTTTKTEYITPTETAVRSTDVVETDESGKVVGGGAVTIKGKEAWSGRGTATYVGGGGTTPQEVKAVAESRGLVGTEIGEPLIVKTPTVSKGKLLEPREKIYAKYGTTTTLGKPNFYDVQTKGVYEAEQYKKERALIEWGYEKEYLGAEAGLHYDVVTTGIKFREDPESFAGVPGFKKTEKDYTISYSLSSDYIKNLPSYQTYTATTRSLSSLSAKEIDIVALQRARASWEAQPTWTRVKSTFGEYGVGLGKAGVGLAEFGITIGKSMGTKTFTGGEKIKLWDTFKFSEGSLGGRIKATPTARRIDTGKPLISQPIIPSLLDRPALISESTVYGGLAIGGAYSTFKGFTAGRKVFGTTQALKQSVVNLSPLKPAGSLYTYPVSPDEKLVVQSYRISGSGTRGTRYLTGKSLTNPDLILKSTEQFKILESGEVASVGVAKIHAPAYYYYGGDLYKGATFTKAYTSSLATPTPSTRYDLHLSRTYSLTGMKGAGSVTYTQPVYNLNVFEGSKGLFTTGTMGGDIIKTTYGVASFKSSEGVTQFAGGRGYPKPFTKIPVTTSGREYYSYFTGRESEGAGGVSIKGVKVAGGDASIFYTPKHSYIGKSDFFSTGGVAKTKTPNYSAIYTGGKNAGMNVFTGTDMKSMGFSSPFTTGRPPTYTTTSPSFGTNLQAIEGSTSIGALTSASQTPILKSTSGLTLFSIMKREKSKTAWSSDFNVQQSKLKLFSAEKTIVTPIASSTLSLGVIPSQRQGSKLFTPTRTVTAPLLTTPSQDIFIAPKTPSSFSSGKGIGVPLFKFPNLQISGGMGLGVIGGRNILKYTPSYTAVRLGVRGRRTPATFGGKFSGFEIRNIIKRFKF